MPTKEAYRSEPEGGPDAKKKEGKATGGLRTGRLGRNQSEDSRKAFWSGNDMN